MGVRAVCTSVGMSSVSELVCLHVIGIAWGHSASIVIV